MPTSEVGAVQSSDVNAARQSPQGQSGEQAAKNRELVKAIKAINEGQELGPNSELRFAFDRGTGQPLIKIVDRVTNEVISQLPPEVILRAAEVLKQLSEGERVA